MAFVPEADTFVPNFGLPFWEWKGQGCRDSFALTEWLASEAALLGLPA
jgi:hypothetical protein